MKFILEMKNASYQRLYNTSMNLKTCNKPEIELLLDYQCGIYQFSITALFVAVYIMTLCMVFKKVAVQKYDNYLTCILQQPMYVTSLWFAFLFQSVQDRRRNTVKDFGC